ncbi:hypothetical protein GCM10010252_74440 [Streptomyces aureoverticillatus]|nr:hypothetical protein GCM10010252_74440 [Streptomyces aureoverticillatus]
MYNQVVTDDESEQRNQAPLTEQQAERLLADMNEVIRAGEEMRKLRTEIIKALAHLGWTQDRIARLTEMTQPAVSKQMARHKQGDPPPMGLSLDQPDSPWLEGRLWGLAEEIAEALDETARCTRYVSALARGKKRFTPQNVDELRRLVEEDLRQHRAELPTGYRTAYDKISRGLDVPSAAAAAGATTPASARRALARRIQRAHLQDGL